jgi:hypothetical protein
MNNVPELIPYGSYQRQQSIAPNTAQNVGSGLTGVGSAAMTMAPMAGPAAPIVAGVGAGMQAVGTIANIYGAYKAQEEQKQKDEEEKKRYERQMQMQQAQIDAQAKQQAFSNEQSSGNYAQNFQDRISKNYGNYYAQNRL